jgi:hypothetical protein
VRFGGRGVLPPALRGARSAVGGCLALLVLVASPLGSGAGSAADAPLLPASARTTSSGLAVGVFAPSTTGLRVPAPAVAEPEPRTVERTAPVALAPPRAARSTRAVPSYPVRRGTSALDALDWPWEELGFDVVFAPTHPRFLGITDAKARRITVYVRRGQSEGDLRTTIAHELGHALDAVTGTEELRAAYRRTRGIDPSVPWYPCDRCDDLQSPAGDFAETFARWLVGPEHVRRTLAPPPDAQQLRELDYFFSPLSTRQG